jgi:predicted SnoaL-like aldol condensation-catalyzing enzyme
MTFTERVTHSARLFSDPAARLQHFSDFYHPKAVFHGYAPSGSLDFAEAQKFYVALWNAFPDFQVRILRAVEEANMMAFHYTWEGTHQSMYAGTAPSGRRVRMAGMSFVRFEGRQVIERWNVSDSGHLMTQLKG